jgi:hypothetical protein
MKHLGIYAAVTIALTAAFSASTGCSSSGGTGGSSTSTSGTSTSGGGMTASSSSSSTSGAGGMGGASTSSSSSTSTSTSTSTSSSGATPPPPPMIGAQIDRIGRPAINTALNHVFDPSASTAGAAKDAYNQDSDPTKWGSNYSAEFAKNLAILDSLDTVCGNQPGYSAPASATSYATLAGALSGDELWMNTAGTTCTAYLAVEANALGLLQNSDCGGRALNYDVIDVSYSVLAAGSLASPPPVGDGVSANDATFSASFPYLAAPH